MSKDFLGRDIDTVAIRESFKDTIGRDLSCTDAVLENFIVGAGKRWTDLEETEDPETEACNLLVELEKQVAKVSVSDPGISLLVSKMDTQFHQEVAACIDAVVKGKTTAVDMYAQFRRIYSKEDMDGMPIPGTENEHVTDNQRPDKVKTKDQTGKPITVVWTNDFVSAMPEAKDWEGKLDDIAKEVKSPGSIPWLKGKSKSDIAALKSDMTSRRNALRSMVKRAISLHHQWEAVSTMPKVGLRWIKGTKDKGIVVPTDFGSEELTENTVTVTKSPKPIWIYPTDDPSEGRDFSVTQFLAFDVGLALNGENGGTMADLVATAGRGAAEPEGDGEGDGSDMPDDAAQAVLSQFHNWFNKRDNQTLVRKKIADRAKDADGNDWLDLIGSIYLLVKPVYEQNRAAYDELIKRDTEAAA